MSTCAICLKPFDPYSKPHLYRQTRGHNLCVLREEAQDNEKLLDELEQKEMQLVGAEDEIEELKGKIEQLEGLRCFDAHTDGC